MCLKSRGVFGIFKNVRPAVRNAILLGAMCCFSYLAVYIARNILSTVSPALISAKVFTESEIGTLTLVYFFTYACGQLINGIIGDRVKAKYMMCGGLVLAGAFSAMFVQFSYIRAVAFVTYGAVGFALSMIYAPMTKVVAENTEPIHAERCSLGYTFASFFGSPVAGVLAGFLAWRNVFHVSNAILIIMGIICFGVFIVFEKKQIVVYNKYDNAKAKNGVDVKILFKRSIVKFTVVAVVTGIVRTTVVFWLPTYISQHLNFSDSEASLIFSASTAVISLSAFIGMFLYERLKRNVDRVLIISFICSAICFFVVFLIKMPIVNICFLMLAILWSNSATTMLWSVYCPSLKDTGMVSSATGFLDFSSYIAAGIASQLFSNYVTTIGWGNLILIWFGLMIVGVAISLPLKKKARI